MAFSITVTQEEGKTILSLEGRLDITAAKHSEQDFDEAVALGQDIVLDMSDLEYIASAGLRGIKKLWKSAKEAGEDLTAINVREDVMDIFEITGFAALLCFE